MAVQISRRWQGKTVLRVWKGFNVRVNGNVWTQYVVVRTLSDKRRKKRFLWTVHCLTKSEHKFCRKLEVDIRLQQKGDGHERSLASTPVSYGERVCEQSDDCKNSVSELGNLIEC